MVHKVKFNKDTSTEFYGKDDAFDMLFLRTREIYLNDLLRTQGYVYLNYIYETLGLCWNPKWENSCILYNNIDGIIFKTCKVKNGYDVTITW